jgi:peptide/nickel transport system substrate-binding protein
MDTTRAGALFEQLVIQNRVTGANEYVLAESIEPNKDATEWTIRLRPDVLFHDGTPFTAADVLYSFKRIQKKNFPGAGAFGPVNLAAATMPDKHTLRIPFHAPFVIFVQGLAEVFQDRMVPQGYNPNHPIGTGPFKFKSFTPGQQSTFVRFDDYWQHGKPYLDQLDIINFSDETAQVNALQSGQVDLINQLSYTSVAAVKNNGGKVVISKTNGFCPFYMRMDVPPFNDVRVRQAMRLVPDRPLFNEQVFGGLGLVANDVFGVADPAYRAGLLPQREQDIEQAKSLLKSAGQSDLRVNLYSAPVGPGNQASASVLVTQAQAAGIKLNLITQDATTYFSNYYAKVSLGMSFWATEDYLLDAQQSTAKGAPYNELHQNNPRWTRLYNEGLKTLDTSKRNEIIRELMRLDYDQGGYLIPVFYPGIEGMTTKVNGDLPNITGFPINGGNNWQGIWLDA